jgi:hypothetical protein
MGINVAQSYSTWQCDQEHETGNIKLCSVATYLHFSGDEAQIVFTYRLKAKVNKTKEKLPLKYLDSYVNLQQICKFYFKCGGLEEFGVGVGVGAGLPVAAMYVYVQPTETA